MWKINAATTSSSVTIFPYIKRRLLPLSTTTTKHTRTFAFHKSFSFGCHWKRKPILHFKFIRGNFLYLQKRPPIVLFACFWTNSSENTIIQFRLAESLHLMSVGCLCDLKLCGKTQWFHFERQKSFPFGGNFYMSLIICLYYITSSHAESIQTHHCLWYWLEQKKLFSFLIDFLFTDWH